MAVTEVCGGVEFCNGECLAIIITAAASGMVLFTWIDDQYEWNSLFAWIRFHLCYLHQPIYSFPSCLCQVMSRRLMKNVLIHYWNYGIQFWGLKLTSRTFTPISWGYHQWRRSLDGRCINWVLPGAAEIAWAGMLPLYCVCCVLYVCECVFFVCVYIFVFTFVHTCMCVMCVIMCVCCWIKQNSQRCRGILATSFVSGLYYPGWKWSIIIRPGKFDSQFIILARTIFRGIPKIFIIHYGHWPTTHLLPSLQRWLHFLVSKCVLPMLHKFPGL